jgi:hypothetical protein
MLSVPSVPRWEVGPLTSPSASPHGNVHTEILKGCIVRLGDANHYHISMYATSRYKSQGPVAPVIIWTEPQEQAPDLMSPIERFDRRDRPGRSTTLGPESLPPIASIIIPLAKHGMAWHGNPFYFLFRLHGCHRSYRCGVSSTLHMCMCKSHKDESAIESCHAIKAIL